MKWKMKENTILFSYPTVSSFWGLTVGKNRINNIPMAYQDSVAIGIITNHIIFNLVFGRIYNLMLEDERRYDL